MSIGKLLAGLGTRGLLDRPDNPKGNRYAVLTNGPYEAVAWDWLLMRVLDEFTGPDAIQQAHEAIAKAQGSPSP